MLSEIVGGGCIDPEALQPKQPNDVAHVLMLSGARTGGVCGNWRRLVGEFANSFHFRNEVPFSQQGWQGISRDLPYLNKGYQQSVASYGPAEAKSFRWTFLRVSLLDRTT